MKYSFTSTKATAPKDQYVVSAGEEITAVAWVLEGRAQPFGVGWRNLCDSAGIADPMQYAGGNERFLLGERLRMGQRLDV